MVTKGRIENSEEGNSHLIARQVYVIMDDDKDFYILMHEEEIQPQMDNNCP